MKPSSQDTFSDNGSTAITQCQTQIVRININSKEKVLSETSRAITKPNYVKCVLYPSDSVSWLTCISTCSSRELFSFRVIQIFCCSQRQNYFRPKKEWISLNGLFDASIISCLFTVLQLSIWIFFKQNFNVFFCCYFAKFSWFAKFK